MRLHPHALERMAERGATEVEVAEVIAKGEQFPARHGRTGFRRNFRGPWTWRERVFDTKQIDVYAVSEGGEWLVITVISRYF